MGPRRHKLSLQKEYWLDITGLLDHIIKTDRVNDMSAELELKAYLLNEIGLFDIANEFNIATLDDLKINLTQDELVLILLNVQKGFDRINGLHPDQDLRDLKKRLEYIKLIITKGGLIVGWES